MPEIEKIDEFLTKFSNFHEDLIDFKKSIDVSVEQDNKSFDSITSYLRRLREAIVNKETDSDESTSR